MAANVAGAVAAPQPDTHLRMVTSLQSGNEEATDLLLHAEQHRESRDLEGSQHRREEVEGRERRKGEQDASDRTENNEKEGGGRRLREKSSSSLSNGVTAGGGAHLKLKKEENLLPKEALLYTPTPEEIYKPVGRGQFVRLIFGDLPLTPYEKSEVAKVKEALRHEPRVFQNTIFADDHFIVRFLQGNEWDVPKCIEDMHRHLHWRKTHLPLVFRVIAPLLARGYCYIFGRDHQMRPIVVIRCKEFINAEPEEVVNVLLFWLEFAIHRLLVKDRVEQWRVIIDLDQCSAFRAPIGTLKDIADNLMRNYRGRLAQMLVINSGFFFWSVWQLLSVVLPERTKQKIVLYTTNYQADLFTHVRRNQVEARYGGTCPDVTEFDVVQMPQGPFV